MSNQVSHPEPVRVAVVGAGFGGLSAAIRLQAAGYQVDVYDQRRGPGGKAFEHRLGEYRFDTGPSLLTLREVFAELFAHCGENIDDYLGIHALETICRYSFPDGTHMHSYQDREKMKQALLELEPGTDPARIDRYFRYVRGLYDIAGELFLGSSLHEASTYLKPSTLFSILRLPGIDALRSMDAAHRSFFDGKLVQLFNRYATYNGSSPYEVPATLNIIQHVEYGLGAWAVDGGIYALPRAMHKLATKLGVSFQWNTAVDRILYDADRKITGILVAARPLPYDVVVTNADVTPTYRDLLQDTDAPMYKRYQELEPSSSGLVFYWGIGRSFPELDLHNIFFSADYPREFADIFDRARCPDEPTVYVNITSKITADDAPDGKENWFVLVNAPYDQGQDWQAETERTRAAVIKRVSQDLGVDIEQYIEQEDTLTPPMIEAQTSSHRGSLYGISSNTRMAAFARHPNRSTRYKGLYFCGGSAHPGGGMPLAVLSGKIAAELVQKYQPVK